MAKNVTLKSRATAANAAALASTRSRRTRVQLDLCGSSRVRCSVVAASMVAFVAWSAAGATAEALANTAPGTPTLVSPRSGATLSADAPQVFTIEATDADGDPYSGTVTVTDASTGRLVVVFSTALAPSGQSSSGSPSVPLPSGSYMWTASASDVFGNTGLQATSEPFTVAGAPDAGGGAVSGSVSFSEPIPAVGQSCAPTSFSLTGNSVASVISFAQSEYTGPINFTGSGGSSCETAASGAGSLDLSVQGLGVTGTTLSCPALSGSYSRVGSDVTVTVDGLCTLNGTETDPVSLAAKVEFAPASGGVGQPVTTATFDGAFAVSPST